MKRANSIVTFTVLSISSIVTFTVLSISLAMIGCKANVTTNDSTETIISEDDTTEATLATDECPCDVDDGYVTFNDGDSVTESVLLDKLNSIRVLDYNSTWSDKENCFTDCEGVIAVDKCVPEIGQILWFDSCDAWHEGDSLRIESITELVDGVYRITGQHVDLFLEDAVYSILLNGYQLAV